jgi:hypothetical protein
MPDKTGPFKGPDPDPEPPNVPLSPRQAAREQPANEQAYEDAERAERQKDELTSDEPDPEPRG